MKVIVIGVYLYIGGCLLLDGVWVSCLVVIFVLLHDARRTCSPYNIKPCRCLLFRGEGVRWREGRVAVGEGVEWDGVIGVGGRADPFTAGGGVGGQFSEGVAG